MRPAMLSSLKCPCLMGKVGHCSTGNIAGAASECHENGAVMVIGPEVARLMPLPHP